MSTISVDGDLILDEEFRSPTGTTLETEEASLDLSDDTLEGVLAALPAAQGFPQYAFKEDYVTSTETVTDYGFTQNADGDPYSLVAGEGVDSGLTDLTGAAIYLFAYGSTNNVVVGVVGDNPNGTVAFALVLDEDITGDNNADMWMIQYQPLMHGDDEQVDANDVLDLLNGTDDIFIQSTYLAPGQGILVTSETIEFEGHDLAGFGGAFLGGSKEIMHSKLAEDFYVQFLGDHATGGSSAVPLTATGAAGAANAFAPGDLFHGKATSIQVTNSTNGVAGDTIQNGEVLDMLFLDEHAPSPGAADPVAVATQYATGMFLRFDGIGNREDLVVVLKLANPNNLGAITTLALVISSGDILRNSSDMSLFPSYVKDAPAGELSYLQGKPLDNNDGMVFIEANDFQFGDYAGMVIVGAQLLASTEKISGAGVNLNGDVGPDGESDPAVTIAFSKSTTQDTDVIKISDIGFIRETPTTVEVHDYLGIGANLIIEDDGPIIDDTSADNLVVNNTIGDDDDGDVDEDEGADGVGAWTIVGAPDSGTFTASYSGLTNQSITGQLGGEDFYTLTVDNDGLYTFTLLGTLPGGSENISSTVIHAGGPTTQKDILLENSTDYIAITGTKDADDTADVNASNGFVGIQNGNLDGGETMVIRLYDDNGTPLDISDDILRDFTGVSIPTKSGNATTNYIYSAYKDDVLVFYDDVNPVAKNGSITVDSGGILFDTLVIECLDGNAVKVGIGDGVIYTLPPDIRLHFDLQLADGDGDTDSVSFYVDIDGNGGGISSPTSYAAGDILL